MSKMKQEDVERIAAEYIVSIGVAPCLLDGSEFKDADDHPIWRVYFSFRDISEKWNGLPVSLTIEVNDVTGEASHIDHL
ncbi:hypothetical protein J8F10_32500 [Gemmata sp. G18]|uniref:PepSY domain-containing protein n=1 Tax=Gemmata palustris TaxID=2822762 RepID=A0ABS5C1X0_9BACT|nr:hypothetical protein [Gemmata palustris]MBP3959987.1 hypothetical protein [Gemmata palustris]